jgi:Caspase domain
MRTALIVANDHYDDAGLGRLTSPAADAQALSRVLGDPEVGGFGQIDVVANESSYVVQRKVEDLFSEARPDDVLLLHFSCHGLKSEAGDLFFAARNTRPDRLASTAVSADFVQGCMRTTRSRYVVLFLDCCYGGAFGHGVSVRASGDAHVLDNFPLDSLGSGRGRAVITASSAMEYAFEAGQLSEDHSERPSVFTSALVEGLSSGQADRDEDGWISLDELYEWVFDRVRDANPNQTPSREIRMQGEFYLARSRRESRWPAPMTAALEAARTSPEISKRLEAVRELRGILIGENVDAALGAFHSLADTATNDIAYVAAEASSALRDAQISLHPQELAFGSVARGSRWRAHL